MKKWRKRLLATSTALVMLTASVFMSSAQTAYDTSLFGRGVCRGNRTGTVNGLSACVSRDGGLHICERNFPDLRFRSYLIQTDGGADGYFTEEELATYTEIGASWLEIRSLEGVGFFLRSTDLIL